MNGILGLDPKLLFGAWLLLGLAALGALVVDRDSEGAPPQAGAVPWAAHPAAGPLAPAPPEASMLATWGPARDAVAAAPAPKRPEAAGREIQARFQEAAARLSAAQNAALRRAPRRARGRSDPRDEFLRFLKSRRSNGGPQ